MAETARGVRRKGIGLGMKSWMVVSDSGESGLQEIDKHFIMRRAGLPARDLRVLDPMLSHPSSILGRDRAIVVNLEHIKAIITAHQALMINSSNPFFLSFLQNLQGRILSPTNETPSQIINDMDPYYEGKPPLDDSALLHSPNNSLNNPLQGVFEDSDTFQDMQKVDTKWSKTKTAEGEEPVAASAPKLLPFEFKALEACIESACTCLEFETQTLEEEAYPALDELTSQISSLNLDRVRQIKNRLVALSGRVQKVADQIEQLLDDDNDMEEMYLTQKLDARKLSSKEDNRSHEEDDESDDNNSAQDKYYGSKPNVKELEMLLEAYFAQINGVSQKLSSLSEYVDDTEDYININLDDKRNQLLQGAVIFDTLNMILSAGIVVVGCFGMNIHIELFDGQPHQFWSATFGTFGGCILLFLISVWWGKKRYLLSE